MVLDFTPLFSPGYAQTVHGGRKVYGEGLFVSWRDFLPSPEALNQKSSGRGPTVRSPWGGLRAHVGARRGDRKSVV